MPGVGDGAVPEEGLELNASATLHYRALPRTTAHYRALPRTTAHYRALPRTTAHYRALPRTTAHYRALPRTTAHCRPPGPNRRSHGHRHLRHDRRRGGPRRRRCRESAAVSRPPRPAARRRRSRRGFGAHRLGHLHDRALATNPRPVTDAGPIISVLRNSW